MQELPDERREVLESVLLELFFDALKPRHDTRYGDYEPLELPVPARYASYTANLMMLAVLNGGQIKGSMLFPHSLDIVHEWRNLALLWRSQLPAEGWSGMTTLLLSNAFGRITSESPLRLNEHPIPCPHYDQLWAANYAPDDYRRIQEPVGYRGYSVWTTGEWDNIERQTLHRRLKKVRSFMPWNLLANYLGGNVVTSFHSYWHDRSVSAANALINLWLISAQDRSADELVKHLTYA